MTSLSIVNLIHFESSFCLATMEFLSEDRRKVVEDAIGILQQLRSEGIATYIRRYY